MKQSTILTGTFMFTIFAGMDTSSAADQPPEKPDQPHAASTNPQAPELPQPDKVNTDNFLPLVDPHQSSQEVERRMSLADHEFQALNRMQELTRRLADDAFFEGVERSKPDQPPSGEALASEFKKLLSAQQVHQKPSLEITDPSEYNSIARKTFAEVDLKKEIQEFQAHQAREELRKFG